MQFVNPILSVFLTVHQVYTSAGTYDHFVQSAINILAIDIY